MLSCAAWVESFSAAKDVGQCRSALNSILLVDTSCSNMQRQTWMRCWRQKPFYLFLEGTCTSRAKETTNFHRRTTQTAVRTCWIAVAGIHPQSGGKIRFTSVWSSKKKLFFTLTDQTNVFHASHEGRSLHVALDSCFLWPASEGSGVLTCISYVYISVYIHHLQFHIAPLGFTLSISRLFSRKRSGNPTLVRTIDFRNDARLEQVWWVGDSK